MNNKQARKEYIQLGFDTLPLKPGKKRTYVKKWQTRDSRWMWRGAPKDANIGIRCGNGLAVIDCDDKNSDGTYENVRAWMASLGYVEYPLVQTASQVGKHIYVNFAGGFDEEFSSRKLNSDIGAGEFRYGAGAYVAAPPSLITNEGAYQLIDGDFNQLPTLDPKDIQAIVSNHPVAEPNSVSIPRRAAILLNGEIPINYKSRSEAEQALILMLVNAGHDYTNVKSLFLQKQCAGKYTELRGYSVKRAENYLRRSFDNAVKLRDQDSKTRQIIQHIREWALSRAWPGRSGSTDRAVLLAHTQIAYKAGVLTYAASSRSLAELAGVQHRTASRATNRLRKEKILTLEKPSRADCANVYRLNNADRTKSPTSSQVGRVEVGQFVHLDAFRYVGLGKSAAEVYAALQEKPLTVKELAERTGRHAKTVKRALGRMGRILDWYTGEIVSMVCPDGDKWHALEVDLDYIAMLVGTAGTAKKQRKRHQAERRAHRRQLALFDLEKEA